NILLIPTQRFDTNGVLGGVQGGWNYQFGRFVLGTEVDFSWADVKGDQTSSILGGIGTVNRSSKATWIGTATTRLGYAWDRVPVNLDIDQRISEIKFGLNYRFGGMGPLVAKY